MKFGQLRLSAKGTNSGRGFDIFYDFGKNHNFVEFTSKPEFYFIQPWMQFPAQEYTDECMRVSIELVHRFNEFPKLKEQLESANKFVEYAQYRDRKVADSRNAFWQIMGMLKNSGEGTEAYKLAESMVAYLDKPILEKPV